MRIDSSTISMASSRVYSYEATEQQTTITRRYNGDELVSASTSSGSYEISKLEAQGSAAVFTTSSDGVTRTDENLVDLEHTGTKELAQPVQQPRIISVPTSGNWLGNIGFDSRGYPWLNMLRQMLERLTGKKFSDPSESQRTVSVGGGYRVSASAASARYQQVTAMLGEVQELAPASRGGGINGHWTRQVVQSGFMAGEETTAFRSTGTVVTADGRTINFGVSVEMSRSFAAAYAAAGKEEIYTDPLVINMDTNAAELSDVSFRFDLNCDGVEEEISTLDASSGFLALDKNGDGEINDGSELFGAKTGDGFGELSQYDQDGNGWIDENDDVFSRLSVWVKCGGDDAQLLSLSEADVGAIFLGSQSTQHTLFDSYGEAGAMVRSTGIYLKESGQVGTVQHVDFKT